MNQFHYTNFAQEVVFAAGAIARIGEAAERYRWRRIMLCTTGSLVRGGEVATLEKALGDRLAATFQPVMPHVPDYQVEQAVALAKKAGIDAVIGMGGGSPVGLAKAVSSGLEAIRTEGPGRTSDSPGVPVIAIPTTYAGSEMTPVYGVTRHGDGAPRKVTVTDPKVAPRLTIYDPSLTLNLSQEMTASTGINSLAHCVEAVYSITRNPLSTAAALGGARRIASALPNCYARGDDLEARSEMLVGAYLAGTALSSVAMGLHHGLCHVLGGTAGVPHGIANAIILPHVMRFNADATAHELSEIAEAMGIERGGRDDEALAEIAARQVSDMVGGMKLPQHLREVGVNERDLPRLAELAAQSQTVKNNPKPATTAQVESILRLAW